MAWTVRFNTEADKQFSKLDKQFQRRILKFLETRIETNLDPRRLGEALEGPLGAFWKYRIGDYRLVCDIQDKRVTVLVLKVGDRKNVYR